MFIRVRVVSSFSFLALTAGLAAACGGTTADNGKGGSSSTGGAGGTGATGTTTSTSTGNTGGGPAAAGCETVCTAFLTCPDLAPCTPPDASAAVEACVSACEGALGTIPASEAQALSACDVCVSQNGGGTCSGFVSAGTSAQCMSLCSGSAYEQALTDWGNAVTAATAGNSVFVCADGENLLGGEDCTGTGGGDGMTSCTFGCCNGSTCAQPTVEISCSGTDPSQLTCTCTAGKSKGKVTSATSCDAAGQLDPWATCNE